MNPRIITASDVNDALVEGLWWLRTAGVESYSRNGRVVLAPGPVLTRYINPERRLVMFPQRDANHVFHLMETIWMLAGQQHVGWLLPFNAQYAKYAERDSLQHGAYGHRWREAMNFDQLPHLINELKKPNTRRAVLQMWSAPTDLGADVNDVPCNTHAYFQVINGKLEMTVCCRSNDVIWGAYGANAVHFSMLQELLARELGAAMGSYLQFSNNFHLYPDFGQGKDLLDNIPSGSAYNTQKLPLAPLLVKGESIWDFLADCEAFVVSESPRLTTRFMQQVALPLKRAYLARKAGDDWMPLLPYVLDSDWKVAFVEWALRRENKNV